MEYFAAKSDHGGSVAVDDTILVQGIEAKAGSHILDSFIPLFNAEAVERLTKAGYGVYGKTHTGEFGIDLVGETSYHGVCRRADGTLSTAAAEAVSVGVVQQALCVDVNGAPRRGAALSGVDFLKPTYGTVSRYGVISTACSGEQIGICASCAQDLAEVFSVIAGHDAKDGTSLPTEAYACSAEEDMTGKKVAIVKELYEAAEDQVKARIDACVDTLRKVGVTAELISLPCLKAYAAAWQIMLSAEICNNVSRYDGVKFGFRTPEYKDIDELYVNTRTTGLGITVKLNVLYGSYVLSKDRYMDCYDKSLRIRRLASVQMNGVFGMYAAVLCPVMSCSSIEAYDVSETFDRTEKELLFTAVPNLTGIPAVVTRGIQLWGPAFGESALLSIATLIERTAES